MVVAATRPLYPIETLGYDFSSTLVGNHVGNKKPGNVGTMQLKLRSGSFATVVDPETSAFNMTTTEQDTDLLVTLASSELVGVHPEQSGWYAALRISQPAIEALERFTDAIRTFMNEHVKDGHKRAFVSPIASDPFGVRLLVKVNALTLSSRPRARNMPCANCQLIGCAWRCLRR